VAAARRPIFYAGFGVPDTVDGRFDMIALHGFLVMNRLKQEGDSAEGFVQSLVDELFRDMDRSLREMGAGDLSVGKKVRRMAEVFYGRADAYQKALEQPPAERQAALEAAIARNVFAGGDKPSAKPIALYVLAAKARLAGSDAGAIMAGQVDFPEASP
jgi:cytochrome b pre-mRNA-processing protein 3